MIKVDSAAEIAIFKNSTVLVAEGALDGCYNLKSLETNIYLMLSSLTNLETLILRETTPEYLIYNYFGYNASQVPLTLKDIVLKDGCDVSRGDLFSGITGVNIYVEANREDVMWDEDYPGWHNGNKVYYGDEWITADFYGFNGERIDSSVYLISQVIRQPYLLPVSDGQYLTTAIGWDLDGDGMADAVPATSNTDIAAHAVSRKTIETYTVTFLDMDGVTPLYRYLLPYGSAVTLPETPTKLGYEFVSWIGYESGMTVGEDVTIASVWKHTGSGHVYADAGWVEPTCTTPGFNKHVCTVCGEYYGTDYVPALGHTYQKTTTMPTCTEAGYDEYICSCGDSYREHYTAALGHTYRHQVIEPSCTTEGYDEYLCACGDSYRDNYTSPAHTYRAEVIRESTCTRAGEIKYTCACGDELREELALAEHQYEKKYVSKTWLQWLIEHLLDIFFGIEGDRAYYFECSACREISTSQVTVFSATTASTCEHSLGDWQEIRSDGGAEPGVYGKYCVNCDELIRAYTVEGTGEDLFTLSGANLLLGEEIKMYFYIPKASLAGEGYYAKITRTYADPERAPHVLTIPYAEWQDYSGSLMRVAYPSIAACQMGESIDVTIYNEEGYIVSQTWRDSVRAYCERMVARDTMTALEKRVMVDLLNYGAAAQTFFAYDAENLINATLTPEQQGIAGSVPALANNCITGANYIGSTLALQNKILLTIYFKNIDQSMYATVSYVDFVGNTKTFTVQGSEFAQNGNYWGVRVDTMMMAEYKSVVSVTVYDSEGHEVASGSDSIESYLSRNLSKDALYPATAKALNSAYEYAALKRGY